VESSADGHPVLRTIEAAPDRFDLIVTDYAMPLMSGGDLLKKARKIRADRPAIIISGYADSRSIIHKPGEAVILTKPFTLSQMRSAIASVMPSNAGPADDIAPQPLAGTAR
jgi:DNA-binding NtrC family response regulator